MSHPIDDLFHKGLSEPDYAYDEQAWQGAQEVLGLKEKKKKRFFWIFGVGALLVASVLLFLIVRGPVASNFVEKEEIFKDEIGKVTDDLSTNTETAIANVIHAPDELGGLTTKEDDLTAESQEELLNEKAISGLRKSEQTFLATVNYSVDDNVPAVEDVLNSRSSELGNEKLKIDNGSNIGDKSGYSQSSQFAQSNISLTTSNENQESDFLKLENQVDQTQLPLVDPEDIRGTVAKLRLDKLIFSPLLLKKEKLEVPAFSTSISEESASILFEKGIYLAYVPTESGMEVGVSGALRFNNNWSLDIGFGLSRASHTSNDIFESTQVGGRMAELSLSSLNNYNYKSFVMPVKLAYNISKHNLFAGLILKRPFSLSGFQEASAAPSMDNMDNVDMPNSAQGQVGQFTPIASNITYNLENVPELNKLLYFGQLGYGFRVNGLIELSAAGVYRLKSQGRVLPLISSSDMSNLKQPSLSGYIRLDYRF